MQALQQTTVTQLPGTFWRVLLGPDQAYEERPAGGHSHLQVGRRCPGGHRSEQRRGTVLITALHTRAYAHMVSLLAEVVRSVAQGAQKRVEVSLPQGGQR